MDSIYYEHLYETCHSIAIHVQTYHLLVLHCSSHLEIFWGFLSDLSDLKNVLFTCLRNTETCSELVDLLGFIYATVRFFFSELDRRRQTASVLVHLVIF